MNTNIIVMVSRDHTIRVGKEWVNPEEVDWDSFDPDTNVIDWSTPYIILGSIEEAIKLTSPLGDKDTTPLTDDERVKLTKTLSSLEDLVPKSKSLTLSVSWASDKVDRISERILTIKDILRHGKPTCYFCSSTSDVLHPCEACGIGIDQYTE